MDEEEYLFSTKGSKGTRPIGRLMARHIIATAGQNVGLDKISCETLRKTYAYQHYLNNRALSYLRKLYNHSSNKVTMRYIGLAPDDIK